MNLEDLGQVGQAIAGGAAVATVLVLFYTLRGLQRQSQVIAEQTSQVAAQTQQMAAQTKNVAEQTKQVAEQTEQATQQTKIVAEQTRHVAEQTEQMAAQTKEVAEQTSVQSELLRIQRNEIDGMMVSSLLEEFDVRDAKMRDPTDLSLVRRWNENRRTEARELLRWMDQRMHLARLSTSKKFELFAPWQPEICAFLDVCEREFGHLSEWVEVMQYSREACASRTYGAPAQPVQAEETAIAEPDPPPSTSGDPVPSPPAS